MTYFNYLTGRKPYQKSDDLVAAAPSLTPSLDEAAQRFDERVREESGPAVDEFLNNHPGAPSKEQVDYYQAHQDGNLPKPAEDGLGVSFIDDRYFFI